jgi:YidC/Oxa1 family membrane protein insertase
MDAVDILLYPVIAPMSFVFELLYRSLGSYGLAIIGTSAAVRLVTYPINKASSRLEDRERLTQAAMAPAIAAAKLAYTGRERFEAVDAIYQQHDYHPFKSLVTLVPLMLQIPLLIAAVSLFIDYPAFISATFLFIDDLSQPDRLLSLCGFTVNLLPVGLALVAVLDSLLNPRMTKQSQLRFLGVTAVLLALIYPLPAAVCLYWFASNLWSFLRTLSLRLKHKNAAL